MNRLRLLSSMLLTFLHTQLFITLISLPLLLSWGLPISIATIVGNLLFAPVLSATLLLGSLIFFGELVSLPTSFLTTILEWITHAWFNILNQGSPSWLYSAPQPSPAALLLILTATLLIIHCRALKNRLFNSGALLTLLIIIGLSLTSFREKGVSKITCFTKELILIRSEPSALIDTGAFGQRGAPQLVATTLIPTLRRQGLSQLEALICLKPSATTFQSIASLITTFPIISLYLPAFETQLNSYIWPSWEAVVSAARQTHTCIISFTHELTICAGAMELALNPDKLVRKNSLTYMAYTYRLRNIAV